METIGAPKLEYLLKSLSDLHAESSNWISETRFWDTELSFFQKLLNKSAQWEADKYDEQIAAGLNGKLIRFKQEAIDSFQAELKRHEQYLGELLGNKSAHNDHSYRESHLVLAERIATLRNKFKLFKKELFSFIQTLE